MKQHFFWSVSQNQKGIIVSFYFATYIRSKNIKMKFNRKGCNMQPFLLKRWFRSSFYFGCNHFIRNQTKSRTFIYCNRKCTTCTWTTACILYSQISCICSGYCPCWYGDWNRTCIQCSIRNRSKTIGRTTIPGDIIGCRWARCSTICQICCLSKGSITNIYCRRWKCNRW